MVRSMPFAAVLAVAMLPLGGARADTSRDAIAAPAGTRILTVQAVGAQIYECKSDGHGLLWVFREPIATLMHEGRTVGRHFAGPTWELADGSSVKGRIIDEAPGATPDDVPWLKLAVAERHGSGDLAAATVVQRVATVGGNKAGPCAIEGAVVAVPYAAEYVFSK